MRYEMRSLKRLDNAAIAIGSISCCLLVAAILSACVTLTTEQKLNHRAVECVYAEAGKVCKGEGPMSEFFRPHELTCKHCGESGFKDQTLDKLNQLRRLYGKPITLSSAYRCPEANVAGGYTQTHSTGQAVDILCNSAEAFELVRLAILCKFTGIGVCQRSGRERFIHLDDLLDVQVKRLNGSASRPAMWSY